MSENKNYVNILNVPIPDQTVKIYGDPSKASGEFGFPIYHNVVLGEDSSGSNCNFPVIGSMNVNSATYNPNANIAVPYNDEVIRFGCTDSRAYNYNPRANRSYDGACWYKAQKRGCTDVNAYNFDPSAQVDDGSCVKKIMGCTDPFAVNYDENANTDDGSCIPFRIGCTDPDSINYDPGATVDSNGCWYSHQNKDLKPCSSGCDCGQ